MEDTRAARVHRTGPEASSFQTHPHHESYESMDAENPNGSLDQSLIPHHPSHRQNEMTFHQPSERMHGPVPHHMVQGRSSSSHQQPHYTMHHPAPTAHSHHHHMHPHQRHHHVPSHQQQFHYTTMPPGGQYLSAPIPAAAPRRPYPGSASSSSFRGDANIPPQPQTSVPGNMGSNSGASSLAVSSNSGTVPVRPSSSSSGVPHHHGPAAYNNNHGPTHHHHQPSFTSRGPPPNQPHHKPARAEAPPTRLPQPTAVVSSGSFAKGSAPPSPPAVNVSRSAPLSRPLPLQPVVHNPNIQSTRDSSRNADKIKVEKSRQQPRPNAVLPPRQEEPAPVERAVEEDNPATDAAVPEPAPQSAQKTQKPNPLVMKSPITLCFERMLGAAAFLAQNPTPQANKKRKEVERNDTDEANPPKNAAEDSAKPPRSSSTAASASLPTKKTKIASKDTSKLEEGNPFLEIEQDEELMQKVILQMALISESKETKRTNTEPVSSTIGEGFYWRDYPVLEEILFDNMKNYYNMSSQNRQSRHQQEFNNSLVANIRQAAQENGLEFDPSFNDKRLRDRIRCFYKTHLQNAKKRLATLQKHPHSCIHQSHLRIYIRCVKQNMSVEDSEAVEGTISAPKVVVRSKSRKSEEPRAEAGGGQNAKPAKSS